MDARAGEMIPSILIGLALASACLALAQSALPGQPDDPSLLLAKISASVLFLLGRFVVERWPVPEGRAHLTGTVIASIALAVLLHQLQVTGEPRETTFLLLLILGAGLSYLDLAWFSILVSLTLGGWVLAAGPRLADPEWTYFGVALLMAAILASIVVVVRVRGTNRVDAFQRQEGVQKLELETALQQTERARQGEEAARKAMERALVQVKESEERFRRLADASFEGVVIFRQGRIVDANARAAELFTVVPAQLIGDPVANLIAPPDRKEGERFLLEAGTRGFVESIEVEGRRYDGSRFPMELSVVDSMLGGRPARVLVIRDVTAQKRVEGVLRRALEEAEANSRAKSSFLANMSHELRTPLNSVIGFANILAKKQVDRVPDREMDYLKRIVANGEHLLALIEDILDLSKIDAQRLEVDREAVDVIEVVEEVVRMLELQAKKKGLDLEMELPETAVPIQADRRRLKQVLLNLTGNGIKFTHEGSVRIRLDTDSEGHPALLEVIDSGIGIPSDQIEEIFSPFHQVDASRTRAFGGSGLGLTISRSLTQLMGFELEVESEPGQGSVFRIDLAAGGRPPTEASRGSAPGRVG